VANGQFSILIKQISVINHLKIYLMNCYQTQFLVSNEYIGLETTKKMVTPPILIPFPFLILVQ
jgi:hypothetical protein